MRLGLINCDRTLIGAVDGATIRADAMKTLASGADPLLDQLFGAAHA